MKTMMKETVKRIFALTAAAVLLLTMVACSGATETPAENAGTGQETAPAGTDEGAVAETETAPETEKVSVILVNATMTDDFSIQVAQGVEDWCAENGFSYELMDPNSDSDTAIEMIESTIVKSPDIMILNPLDADALVTATDKAVDAGIVVAAVGNVSNSKKIPIAVHSDHYQGGVITAEKLVEAIGGKGKLLMLGLETRSMAVEERVKGFQDVIAEYPEIELVDSQYAAFDSTAQMAVAENMLQAHPDAVGCFADLGVAGIGMASAAVSAGRDNFMIVDIDADREVCRYINSGDILCAAAQLPYDQTIKACEEALKCLRGETYEAEVLYEHLLTDSTNVAEVFQQLYGFSLDEYLSTAQ